jgi:hypothetical protein
MGNAVPCLVPESHPPSSDPISLQPSFGVKPQPHHSPAFSIRHRHDQANFADLQRLRLKILQGVSLKFREPTIIILYAPPEFQIQEVGDFISRKVELPLLDLDSLAIRKLDESKGQDSENLQCAFEYRVLDSDCRKGFVLLGYPETPKQLRNLRDRLPTFVTVPLFIDLDSDVGIPLDILSDPLS